MVDKLQSSKTSDTRLVNAWGLATTTSVQLELTPFYMYADSLGLGRLALTGECSHDLNQVHTM
jgi:hypothetical protein